MAHVAFTSRADGDLRIDAPAHELAARRRAVVDLPWSWCRQVHGAGVEVVTTPGLPAGAPGDALVTRLSGAALAVQVADCAPVALVGERAVGVVHVGWRGLVEGVVPAAVAALHDLDAGPLVAVIGPCIHPAAYEFGEDALTAVEAAVGRPVGGRTAAGGLALDLPAAVTAALDGAGVPVEARVACCTAGSPDVLWSHRARGDVARTAVVAWIEEGS